MQRLNQPFDERLKLLESESALVNSRDDLYMELIRVQNQMGNAAKSIELLKTHRFTPCEGGEHELVDLWIFAHFSLGREAFRKGNFQKALEYFQAAQVFPENLGAGIWNESFAIPSRYYEARCLTELGQQTQAAGIYCAIANSGTDSFTYMYQPAFDCYRAMAFMAMGRCGDGQQLLEQCLAKWDEEKRKPDYGYFKATPFWLSYMENPATARAQHYEYLIGMASTALGQKERAAKAFEEVIAINSGHCWARIELEILK